MPAALITTLPAPPAVATPWCAPGVRPPCMPGATPPPPPPPPDAAIARVLDDSAAAWSRGDLDGFMAAYENGPNTTFVTPSGLVKGWSAMRDRYRRRYGAGAALGALSFSDLTTLPLGTEYAVTYGRFHLRRSGVPAAAKEETGVFDLVMHLTPEGWRILSDHTS